MGQNLHLWMIPLLPLAGAAINGFFGRRFSKKTVSIIALASTGIAFALALWVAWQFSSLSQVPHIETHMPWLAISGLTVNFEFYLDQLSLVMLLVVTGVGFLIHVYSVGYMADDDGYYRFFAYLNLFMFFMLMLVLASNYLLMFVGWEGVGLASYLLIGFFFLKESAAKAGKKAFIVNRIGDFAFLLGMFLIVKYFHSLDYRVVFPLAAGSPVENAGAGLMTLIAFCLMIGATGKSAQIPLYVWLPDAMEGPTPVSALIHAATMVTAGIYMVARSHAIFNDAPTALLAVAVIGAVTAIFAASIGMVQTDIKRVLAYSTISQLGYMFMACGVAAYSAAIFHLMTHAFFKALLFLSAGSVIHALSGEQDMRHMGGLRKSIPWTFGVMTIGTVAIAGIPGLAGFFSKDEILWRAFSRPHGSWVFWLIGVITALMTSFYMFRLLFMTFFGERRGPVRDANEEPHSGTTPMDHPHRDQAPVPSHAHAQGSSDPSHASAHAGHGDHAHGVHESPWIMLAPLVILAFLSVTGGWIGVPAALGGSNHFEHFLDPVFADGHGKIGGEISVTFTDLSDPVRDKTFAKQRQITPATSEASNRRPEPPEGSNLELELTGISILAAFLGLFAAWFLYVRDRSLPERIAHNLSGLYRLVLNKYYVDEVYQEAVVDPVVQGSTKVLWQSVDVGVIDATVNGSATLAKALSGEARRMQSGNIRSYGAWVAIGAAALVAYMLWIGALAR